MGKDIEEELGAANLEVNRLNKHILVLDKIIVEQQSELVTARKDAKIFHDAWKSCEKENQHIKSQLPTTEK